MMNIDKEGEIMKKFGLLIIMFVLLFTIGCGKEEQHVEGELADLMTKIYEGVPQEQLPMMLTNIEVTDENVEYYLGSADIEFESALASESGVGSIAHSIVLVRAKDGQNIEDLQASIRNNVNPRKWICVGVEEDNIVVDSIGDLVILIMNNDLIDTYHENFKKLK